MQSTRESSPEIDRTVLLNAKQVAERLSLGRATIYELMASGQLPTVRLGRAVRVPAYKLAEWVERQSSSVA
jgi:excisionase family DNA binding protein